MGHKKFSQVQDGEIRLKIQGGVNGYKHVMRKPKIHITKVRKPGKSKWTEALSNNS